MRQRQFLKLLAVARGKANDEMYAQARSGGKFASGLASEGYVGGYIQALNDVDAVLTHGYPNDPRRFWETDNDQS